MVAREELSRRKLARQLVTALLAGGVLGFTVALLVLAPLRQSAVALPPERLFWLTLLLSLGGALAGLALAGVMALEATSNDHDAYPRRRR
ncbi:MAG: hypothetical protein VKO00_01420 [Cyanobacteriota bacterium]|nr:hypothetical protein [Cyanobacteriota bacterium]